jgi:TolA-binding protein
MAMNPEFLNDDALKKFESELKKEAPDAHLHYRRVEDGLFDRIIAAEKEGDLLMLKMDDVPPEEVLHLLEHTEEALFKHIHDHNEYDVPVDECIKNNADLPPINWKAAENRFDEQLAGAATLSVEEQLLKMDEILDQGRWEKIEEQLDTAIAGIESISPWEQVLKAEELPPAALLDTTEDLLIETLERITTLPEWEQVLQIDEAAPQALFERAEQTVSDRVTAFEKARQSVYTAFTWYWGLVWTQYKTVSSLAVTLFLLVSLGSGYLFYHDYYQALPMTLYQAQGPNTAMFNAGVALKGTIRSEKNGGLTVLNKKGYIELQNGSQVEIVKATEKTVEYKTRFADAGNQLIGRGSATFFVNHQKKDDRYIVSTADYHIEVTGTYFKICPDIGGHVSTAVREGSVRIVFASGEVKVLKAGQELYYDLSSNTYATNKDGAIIPRQEIEQPPALSDLSSYQRLSINSVPPSGVRIDGKYVGMTPIVILQPAGRHSVSFDKNGYASLDTSISIAAGQTMQTLAALLQEIPLTEPAVSRTEQAVTVGKTRETAQVAKQSVKSPSSSDANYGDEDFLKAEKIVSSDWKKSFELYGDVFNNPNAPRIKKETALFMMAKLIADNTADKTGATEGFLYYLAAYPTGYFVGESWLRLAELEFEHNQDKAIEYYLKYFEKYPRHYRIAELQQRVGLIYLQKKKYDDAIAMFKLAFTNIHDDSAAEKSKISASLYKALNEKEKTQNARSTESAQLQNGDIPR